MKKYKKLSGKAISDRCRWFETTFPGQSYTDLLKMSGKEFALRFKSDNGGDEQELLEFHHAVSSASAKAWHLFFSLYNAGAADMPEKAGVYAGSSPDHGISYSDIFGDITTAGSGPDVFSPAAYLADLLRIVETYITSSFDIPDGFKLSERRPDLYTLALTKENTETLLPYTDLITKRLTEVLAGQDEGAFGGEDSGQKTLKYCAENVYPVGLPCSLPYKKISNALCKEGFGASKLLKLFQPEASEEELTAAAFGISIDYYHALMDCGGEFYPEAADLKGPANVDIKILEKISGLDLEGLDKLFRRGIEDGEKFSEAAETFYINQKAGDCLMLSDDLKTVKGLTVEVIADLVRFVRFSKITGLTYSEFDAIIENGDIKSALSRIAYMKNTSAGLKLLKPLISSLYDYGPEGTFQKVYGESLSLSARYDFDEAVPALAESLGLSENDIRRLFSFLSPGGSEVSAGEMNSLYRNTFLIRLLGIGTEEYIALAGLLGIDGRALAGHFSEETLSAFLLYNDMHPLNAFELDFICSGTESSYAGTHISDGALDEFLNGIKTKYGLLPDEKRNNAVEQELMVLLGIDQSCSRIIFDLISPVLKLPSWQENFYSDSGRESARKIITLISRADFILKNVSADLFLLFSNELFSKYPENGILFSDLALLFQNAKFYAANPVFYMLTADAFFGENKIRALSELCSMSGEEVSALGADSDFSMEGILTFVRRLDAVKSIGIKTSVLNGYLAALIKKDGYDDLLKLSAGLPAPDGSGKEYCTALTALAVAKLNGTVSSAKELSDYLLMDVLTEDPVSISCIREGVNAVLTYLNRCRTGLERGVGRIDEISEEYWSWIMDYSEWKSNRMIFVRPENYLLPDIRTSQSKLFQDALQTVSGKPMDLKAAETLYSRYLSDYTSLSQITPCASYLASDKSTEKLYLFGRAKANGETLFYCIRTDGIWGEWTEIPAAVPAAEITPIYIFGKLFLFWLEQSSAAVPEISYKPENAQDENSGFLQNTLAASKFSVKYTCLGVLGTWSDIKTLSDDFCIINDPDTDYGGQFKNSYDINSEGYKRLAAFRITERNFCDPNGRYYLAQSGEFEKLLILYGGFVYNLPDDEISEYFPLKKPFETSERSAFSSMHARLADEINILTSRGISGRLISGSVRVYGSTLMEESVDDNGEFLIFDEYTGGENAAAPAAAVDESSSVIDAAFTADVIKDTLCGPCRITPKFSGIRLPEYDYIKNHDGYSGEFSDTLNTYILGTDSEKALQDFQKYLDSSKTAVFKETGDGGKVTIDPERLCAGTFYSDSYETGITPVQYSDLYSILLKCLGSQRLFGDENTRIAADCKIIKTGNLAGGFILQTAAGSGEAFLLTPASADGEGGRLLPIDSSLAISYPKITADDIEKALGGKFDDKHIIFDLLNSADPTIIDIDGYAYMPNVSRENLRNALKNYKDPVPDEILDGLLGLLNDRRIATSRMFWSQNIDEKTSADIFSALTGSASDGFEAVPVNSYGSFQMNPKEKLRGTKLIGTSTPDEVSDIFKKFVNAPLPVSLRYNGKGGRGFDTGALKYDVTRITNPAASHIISRFAEGGTDAFLKLENQQAPVPPVYPIERFAPNTDALNLPPALDGAQADFDGLYKNYNYELFYYLPIYAAKTLRAFGNYPDARKWLEYIYSPLSTEQFIDARTFTPAAAGYEGECIRVLAGAGILMPADKDGLKYRVKYGFTYDDFEKSGAAAKLSEKGLSQENINGIAAILSNFTLGGRYGYCWQFFPFRSRTLKDLTEDLNDSAELRNYHNNPFDPHAIASLRIGAYEKYTVLEYVDLLTEWGDSEFAKLTWDSLAAASSLYGIAADILGTRPVTISSGNSAGAKSFLDLYKSENSENHIGTFFNTLIKTMLSMPGDSYLYDAPGKEFFFPYFQIPPDPNVAARWDTVNDRLGKLRKNLDINGNPRTIPQFSQVSDPLELARIRGTAGSSGSVRPPVTGDNWYRYPVLFGYAREFTTELISFSSRLLSSMEKGDEEALRVLSARQSEKLVALSLQARDAEIKQLEYQKNSLQSAKSAAQARFDYYDSLIKENISAAEKAAIGLTISAGAADSYSAALATGAGAAALVPEAGSPFAMVYGGREISSSFMNFSMASMSLASSLHSAAEVTGTYASYARRLAEWNVQRHQAELEAEQLDNQISALEEQQKTAEYDRDYTILMQANTAELLEYYKTKFSSCSLYSTLSGQLRQIVFHSYQTALELAARAQTAWQEETGDDTAFLTYAYWDDTSSGLLSGERLMSALDSMQAAYISKNPRRPEMTRTISLARDCPNEFASLQSGNTCSFTLPLSLFDNAERPKYYMHKIRSVTVNIDVLIGVFQNIRARLVQTGSLILNDPSSREALEYVSKYDIAAPVPEKVTVNRRAGQSISISEAVNESGMRSFSSADSAYLPFEGTGAVSKWQLEFEDENPFDLKDIGDVILNITYTALESGKV